MHVSSSSHEAFHSVSADCELVSLLPGCGGGNDTFRKSADGDANAVDQLDHGVFLLFLDPLAALALD